MYKNSSYNFRKIDYAALNECSQNKICQLIAEYQPKMYHKVRHIPTSIYIHHSYQALQSTPHVPEPYVIPVHTHMPALHL